jgi:formylglycine-generating enzyme required for sulfatase activity
MVHDAQLKCFIAVLMVALPTAAAQAVTIETVLVGNTGNTGDPATGEIGWGAVDYAYYIGTYEVTAGQYAEFLNAVAATDTYGLYNTDMWSNTYGCKIERTGSSGSYSYSVASDWANRPVNYVSWGDAARFANWLHNGQPTGTQGLSTTEDGAYYMNGATTGAALMAVSREADWKWAIPTENEWYKAAYHKNDGDTANYFDYPTSSDSVDISMANYLWSVGHTTDVGSYAYPSPYGTFDQGGNVREWTEAIAVNGAPAYRVTRGGSYRVSADAMQRHSSTIYTPVSEYDGLGFRVGSPVPEPGSLAMLTGLAVMGLFWWRRRKAA